MNELGKILKDLRLERGYTLDKLCELLNNQYQGAFNFNKGKLSKWENGKEEPRLSSLRLLTNFYGINIDNLNSMIDERSNIVSIYNQLHQDRKNRVIDFAENQLLEQKQIIKLQEIENVIEYVVEAQPWKVSAGNGLQLPDYNETISMKVKTPPPVDYDHAWLVSGDSMEPLFVDGDIIYTKKITSLQQGQIIVVLVDDELFVKKVSKEKGCLRLISLNKKYDDIIANENNFIEFIGRVVL